MLINFAHSLPDYLHILISIIPSLLFFKYMPYLQPYIGLNLKEAFQNKTEQKKTKQTNKKTSSCMRSSSDEWRVQMKDSVIQCDKDTAILWVKCFLHHDGSICYSYLTTEVLSFMKLEKSSALLNLATLILHITFQLDSLPFALITSCTEGAFWVSLWPTFGTVGFDCLWVEECCTLQE